jgi:hypothetical protein
MPPDISIQKNNINSEVNRQQVPLSAASSTHTHTHTHTYTPPDTSIEYGRIHYKKKKKISTAKYDDMASMPSDESIESMS